MGIPKLSPTERMSRPTSFASPSAQTIRADCIASAERSSEMPTYWPCPLRSRSNKAEATPVIRSRFAIDRDVVDLA